MWLANKGAFPAKIRTKVLIYLGNQKDFSLIAVVLTVIYNPTVSLGFTVDLLIKDLAHE